VNQYFNKQNGTTTKHVFLGGELVATIVGNGVSTSTYIVHTDHLMGTGIVTNASGTVVETVDYYPYGEARLDQGSYSDQRKFTGHEYDPATSLTFMGARYYTGARGEFLSEDPAFLEVGGSRFASAFTPAHG
jgi:RHS repeat-associated protein